MNWRDVPIPLRMQGLPRDPRGYPIPANVYLDKTGQPHFTINDEPTRLRQILDDLCPICDGLLFRGRWFVGGPLAAFHPDGAFIDLPMHRECATYALMVCPYLAMPSYGKRLDAATLKRVDPASRGEVVFMDPTQIPEKPDLFICAMSIGHTNRDNYVLPNRPWRRIEYWKDGMQLPDGDGQEMVRKILEAPLPERRAPRLVRP